MNILHYEIDKPMCAYGAINSAAGKSHYNV